MAKLDAFTDIAFFVSSSCQWKKTAMSTLQTNCYITHGHLIPFACLGRIEHRDDLIPAEPILIERLVDILVAR